MAREYKRDAMGRFSGARTKPKTRRQATVRRHRGMPTRGQAAAGQSRSRCVPARGQADAGHRHGSCVRLFMGRSCGVPTRGLAAAGRRGRRLARTTATMTLRQVSNLPV